MRRLSATYDPGGGWLVGISKFRTARSRLYRSQILQVNIHLKALDEIYKISRHYSSEIRHFPFLLENSKLQNIAFFCQIRSPILIGIATSYLNEDVFGFLVLILIHLFT